MGWERALHLKLPWWKRRAGLEMVRGAGSSDGERMRLGEHGPCGGDKVGKRKERQEENVMIQKRGVMGQSW